MLIIKKKNHGRGIKDTSDDAIELTKIISESNEVV